MNRLIVLMVVGITMLLCVASINIQTTPVKGGEQVILLQGIGIQIQTTTTAPDKEEGKKEEPKEESKSEEETEEEEEEELDYELGKVDPNTKKAVRYVCPDCGEVQLEPFKCEICEKDAQKEELDVEEKDGKWFIKGTKTQVVEKEPEEEEEEEEKKEEKPQGSERKGGGPPGTSVEG
ncbi:MAG: hypothetical protein ACK4NF_07755, partial [Planctomycetota bacterium]